MATSEIYTLSLHDALPISRHDHRRKPPAEPVDPVVPGYRVHRIRAAQDHEIGLRTRAVAEGYGHRDRAGCGRETDHDRSVGREWHQSSCGSALVVSGADKPGN